MHRFLVVILLAWLLPAAAEAQAPNARIEAAKRRAAAAGVPVALLESRVAEGRAKGAPAERIAAVVEQRSAALIRARTAMSQAPSLTGADLDAGADALEKGIDDRALRAVIDQARSGDRAVAISVLTYLHSEQGLPVGEALDRVSRALKQGPDKLRDLPSGAQGRGNAGERPPKAGKGTRPGRAPEALPTPGRKPGAGKPTGKGGKPGKRG